MRNKRRILIAMGLLMAGSALVVLYGTINPESSALFPQCLFKALTGYDCPGCGSQRAIHHLLHLRFQEAIKVNALFTLAIPYVALLFVTELLRSRYAPFTRLYRILFSAKAIWVIFTLIVVWWVWRNLPVG